MSSSSDKSKDNESLVVVASCAMESEAILLVDILADAGIRAVATGGFTAGFRAEAPGDVKVQVLENDVDRAKQVLSEVEPLPET